MTTIAKREYLVVGVLAAVLLAAIIPSLLHARREYRDGIRRAELIELKSELERRNNDLGYYPADFFAGTHEFVVVKGDGQQADGWFLRAELENAGETEAGFDFESNVYYRVVNTDGGTFYDICGGTFACGVERIE